MIGIGRDPEKDPHPLLVKKHRESLLEEETLDLHLIIEVDPDPHLLEDSIQTPFGKER